MNSETINKIVEIVEGSVWKAPNRIWTTCFAKNKSPEEMHPALVEQVNKDRISAVLIPGTSKGSNRGDCAFKIKLTINSKRESNFLLNLSMTYKIDSIKEMIPGWDDVKKLSDDQLDMLSYQRYKCPC